MLRIITSFIFIVFFLNGCLSEEQKQTIKENRVELGDIKINYYSDKSVTSLEIPPDLTSPSYENSFRISEIANDVDLNVVNLSSNEIQENNEKILTPSASIQVKKLGNRRWLIVDKKPEIVWSLSKQFLKQKGFVIKKSNKKIGIMETDYLENKPVIPAKSLGLIRGILSQSENVSYALPSVDKYTLRIEPYESGEKSEVHLSISSMKEVVQGSGKFETTIWQSKEKDISLEAEMLYALMVYLGGDSAKAREEIINAKDEDKIKISLQDGINGYAKLVFNANFIETWDHIAWALTELNIELEDKDIKEKSFYVSASPLGGIMSSIFGNDAIKTSYQIQLKQVSENFTEVYFNDISEENNSDTKEYNYDLFKKISILF